MPFLYLLKTALTALHTNKVRAALTVLGIVIGISSIIMVMSLGKGAEVLILGELNSWGSRTISLEAGKEPEGMSDMMEIFSNSLRESDLLAIQSPANVRNIEMVTPMVIMSNIKKNLREEISSDQPRNIWIFWMSIQKKALCFQRMI
jgi:ABC-type antimicrobial peptide transport system permease subunit